MKISTTAAAFLIVFLAVFSATASARVVVVDPDSVRAGEALKPGARYSHTARILFGVQGRARPGYDSRETVKVAAFTPHARQTQQLLILTAGRVEGQLWLRVRLSQRPNSSAAWIPAARTRILRNPWRISVSRAQRKVRVLRAGRTISRFRVVVGEPGTPTPTGLFAVFEKERYGDPNGFLGPFALHLTAHSNTLDSYGGGKGRVAFHGRGGESLLDPLGSAASHGCVRMNNSRIRFLFKRIPTGTPVRIS